ncbi:MAG: efflux RND transporter permease subunit [Planctomycetes bacterium]|nr:efflux RND transporter permease subunit [Planctomycetota bacterium]
MTRLGLRNPYLVAVFALAVLVLGGVSYRMLPNDLLPIFKTPAVQILTLYPGMPAEVVEQDITSRLERWTGQSNGIAWQESRSLTGVSVVRDYFREDVDPNTAMSQVTSLAMSDLYYLPPGTIPPMVMPFDPTASIPLCLLSVSSEKFDETDLYDLAYFNLRNRLQGIPGVIAPAVFGGKIRRILIYGDPDRMRARNLSLMDLAQAVQKSNVMIPLGSMKIGDRDFQFEANSMVPRVSDLNDIPVRIENGAPVYIRDVGEARDANQIQTNIVRVDGKRQLYVPIYRQPGANTIRVVDGVRDAIPQILSRLPDGVRLDVVMDQSVYVRKAIESLLHEGVLGAILAGAMVFLFLGTIRSTAIICLAIPLSILAAFVGLHFTHQTVNAMTLGGLALAVGRLVDDAIVVLENVHRHLRAGKAPMEAAIEGTREVGMPVLVATLTTIAVFAPVLFLSGLGKFLFTPLALAVAFSMAASYVVAIFLVPSACSRLLRGGHGTSRMERAGDRLSERLAGAYRRVLRRALAHRAAVALLCLAALAGSLALYPRIGNELFPAVDAGQFTVRVRAPSGTRLEVTERHLAGVEAAIARAIPESERTKIITNIGILLDWPAAYTPNAGPMDAFVLVQLSEGRTRSAQAHVEALRGVLAGEFPSLEFSYDTGGLVTAALNFGLPSPINLQIEGNKLDVARGLAEKVRAIVAQVSGTTDVRIEQRLDYPQVHLDVDRVKAAHLGLTQGDVVRNVVSAMNSSVTFAPSFWIDPKNGNHYFIGAQYAETDLESIDTIRDVSLTGPGQPRSVPVSSVAEFSQGTAPAQVNHFRISRVTDVYANVSGRDVGSVSEEIEERLAPLRAEIAGDPAYKGYAIHMRGEVKSMKESFASLGFGLGLAAVLVYLILVAQFRSFLDPVLVMVAVPLGLIGVLGILWATSTTLNIQSLLGVIFMVGISVSNSVLLVDFANRLREAGRPLAEAVLEAGAIRLRPILMTSIAAILGLLPMAIGLGHGSEANVPLARAVIGGLAASTALTLFLVPVLYTLVKRKEPVRA